jgi:hypothetical protein
MVKKEVRNASTSFKHTYGVLSGGAAICTASAWLAAAAAINSTTANLERLDTAAAVAELAVQHRRAIEQQTPASAAALQEYKVALLRVSACAVWHNTVALVKA